MQSIDNFAAFYRVEAEITVAEFEAQTYYDNMNGRKPQPRNQVFERIVNIGESEEEPKQKKKYFKNLLQKLVPKLLRK